MTGDVTFRPTSADRAAAASAMGPRRWGRYEHLRLVGAGVCLLLLVFVVMARYVWQAYGLFILHWEDAGGFAVAGGAMGWLYGRRRSLPADDPAVPERTVRTGREGFSVTGKGFATSIDWSVVKDIVERDGTILLVTDWQEVHFVPERAFASPAEADAFVRNARDAWTARRAAVSADTEGTA